MMRTQVSLSSQERRTLDTVGARTGRSMSALIRDAIMIAYGTEHAVDDDLAAMLQSFGSWQDRDSDGAAWVDERRSGSRLAQRS